MTLAAVLIFLPEASAIRALDTKYMRVGEERISLEEFLCRASLDDIIRMRHYTVSAFMAFCLMTIGSPVKL